MTKKLSLRRKAVSTAGIVLALGIGLLGGGAAVAAAPMLFAPAGVQPEDGSSAAPMPQPSYAENSRGESYGTAADAPSPDAEPDLIQAVASNGKEGFVRKTELDEANGSTAAASFKSPEDALKWQNDAARQADVEINVYAKDGVTVIGTFVVAGYETQSKVASQDPSN